MITVPVLKPDGTRFGHIDISCIESRGRHPDDVNVYEASIHDQAACGQGQCVRNVTVEHRYGDHWTVLLRKVLEAHAVTHHQ